MPLSLEQYAAHLKHRGCHWPAPPVPESAKAKPHLVRLRGLRAVLWNAYGTLLSINGGEIWFDHPQPFIMETALDRTVQEFKMWGAMTRRPGQPSEYLASIYQQALMREKMASGYGERFREVSSERVWEAVIKILMQKDYQFDAGYYGSLNEFSRKVAYFFHACLQGTACYSGAADGLVRTKARGLLQGLLADAQPFTLVQLQCGVAAQEPAAGLDDLIDSDLRILSCEWRVRKPAERLFRQAQMALAEHGVSPDDVLHIGSNVTRDLIPARRMGFRTALFAGDKGSLQATADQLKDPFGRPDVLLTDLDQLAEVIP